MYYHKSVLRDELLAGLQTQPNDIVVDCTLGGGGHSLALASELDGKVRLIGIDLDQAAIDHTREKFHESGWDIDIYKSNFRYLDKVLQAAKVEKVDRIMLDLGVSSYHFDESGRGFTFKKDEPLAMTLGESAEYSYSAREIVNEWQEESLADIIYGYGEERQSRQIAAAIVRARREREINTSGELAEIVSQVVARRGKTHPATKTFQALRIAVNDELGALQEVLSKIPNHLRSGGRVGIISFHSLEDRIIKNTFREWERDNLGKRVNKKVIVASREEIKENPRARSAKLRLFEKSKD